MFWTRLVSGIILVILTALTMILGGNVLLFTIFAIAEIGLFELYKVMKMENSLLGKIGYTGTAFWFFVLMQDPKASVSGVYFMLILAAMTIFMLLAFVLRHPRFSAIKLFTGVFGFVYVPFMLSFIYMTREGIRLGEWIVWLIYIASWGSDTCAYVVGRLFGKKKLAPVLSPKKSVEGSIGGILGAGLLGSVFALVMMRYHAEPITIVPAFAVIGAVGSIISQIGDLAASGIKRSFDVKDYGKLIPGHGGILDRFDSIIITAPIVYFLADYFMKNFK